MAHSENRFSFNVWTPHIGATCRRPVMVWSHGGGREIGSSVGRYDGIRLAKRGVIVVNLD